MVHINYGQYNLKQLKDALLQLDEEQFPDDAKIIRALIQAESIHSNQANKSPSKNKFSLKKEYPYWTHLITAGLLFGLALYIHFANRIPFLNLSLDLPGASFTKIALVLSFAGSGLLSLFNFLKEYLGKK